MTNRISDELTDNDLNTLLEHAPLVSHQRERDIIRLVAEVRHLRKLLNAECNEHMVKEHDLVDIRVATLAWIDAMDRCEFGFTVGPRCPHVATIVANTGHRFCDEHGKAVLPASVAGRVTSKIDLPYAGPLRGVIALLDGCRR